MNAVNFNREAGEIFSNLVDNMQKGKYRQEEILIPFLNQRLSMECPDAASSLSQGHLHHIWTAYQQAVKDRLATAFTTLNLLNKAIADLSQAPSFGSKAKIMEAIFLQLQPLEIEAAKQDKRCDLLAKRAVKLSPHLELVLLPHLEEPS